MLIRHLLQPAPGAGPTAGGVACSVRSAGAEEVQTTASQNVLQELANALEQTGRAMPAIRKIWLPAKESWPEGAYISIYDVIRAVKGCNMENASNEFHRIQERYGDGSTICRAIRFRD